MSLPKVILIGGAPLTGKTTVAILLATRLGYACISTDDISAALRAVTTSETHPDLHPMGGQDYRTYYVRTSPKKLIHDADFQLQATWPAVAAVIREHATWRVPAVIEGWGLRPEWVAEMDLQETATFWLIADDETIRQRLLADTDFLRWASNKEKLIEHFAARSIWYNRLIAESAARIRMPTIHIPPTASPDEIYRICLQRILGPETKYGSVEWDHTL
ncbi:MAG TPA: hypothetical protein VMG59_01960 [Phycisphaerae bacterium]|nr:hypothetical protein [Phycisphaerae bacterium]